MASYSVAASGGEVAANDKTLVANTVDTVTFDQAVGGIEVLTDGSAAVYFTIDGTAPTVSGSHCYKVPSAPGSTTSLVFMVPGWHSAVSQVQLISSGTPTYSVIRVQ